MLWSGASGGRDEQFSDTKHAGLQILAAVWLKI
jgi:hypothetical protein